MLMDGLAMESFLKNSMPAVMAPDISVGAGGQGDKFCIPMARLVTSFNSDLVHDSEGNDEDETEPTGWQFNAGAPHFT